MSTEPAPLIGLDRDRLRSDVRSRLDAADFEALRWLGFENFLAVATVSEGLRLAARLDVGRDVVATAEALASSRGLVCVRANFDVVKTGTPGVSDAVALPVDIEPSARAVLYVAESFELAQALEWIERANDYDELGAALGYPGCCTREFRRRWREAVVCPIADSISTVGPHPSAMNPALAGIHGIHLMFHQPCDGTCAASAAIASAHLAMLSDLSPEFAKVPHLAEGYVVGWGTSGHLAHVMRSHGDSRRRVVEAIACRDEVSASRLRTGDVVTISGPHDVTLRDVRLTGPRTFVAQYLVASERASL